MVTATPLGLDCGSVGFHLKRRGRPLDPSILIVDRFGIGVRRPPVPSSHHVRPYTSSPSCASDSTYFRARDSRFSLYTFVIPTVHFRHSDCPRVALLTALSSRFSRMSPPASTRLFASAEANHRLRPRQIAGPEPTTSVRDADRLPDPDASTGSAPVPVDVV